MSETTSEQQKQDEGKTENGQPQLPAPSRDAGRALDTLVAEKVMGIACAHQPVMWTREEVIADERAYFLEQYEMEAPPSWVGDTDSILSGDYPPYKCARCGEVKVPSRSVVKPYSTDIRTAWEVVEKLRDGGWWPEVKFLVDWDRVAKWYAACHRPPHIWSATGDTAPLAICRAALAAVGAV